MGNFKPQNINMNDINRFVKSGAFDKQMKQHMPAIMEKVKKVDQLSKGEAIMNSNEVAAFADKIAMKVQTGNITDMASYLGGVKIAAITLGYEKGWVEAELLPVVKERVEKVGA